jgi:hypothetical protein
MNVFALLSHQTTTPTSYSIWEDFSSLFVQVKVDDKFTKLACNHVESYTKAITTQLSNHFIELKGRYKFWTLTQNHLVALQEELSTATTCYYATRQSGQSAIEKTKKVVPTPLFYQQNSFPQFIRYYFLLFILEYPIYQQNQSKTFAWFHQQNKLYTSTDNLTTAIATWLGYLEHLAKIMDETETISLEGFSNSPFWMKRQMIMQILLFQFWSQWALDNEFFKVFTEDIKPLVLAIHMTNDNTTTNSRDTEVMSHGDAISILLFLAKEVMERQISLPDADPSIDLSTVHSKISTTKTNLFATLSILMKSKTPTEFLEMIFVGQNKPKRTKSKRNVPVSTSYTLSFFF